MVACNFRRAVVQDRVYGSLKHTPVLFVPSLCLTYVFFIFYNDSSRVVVDFLKETTEVLGAFRQFPPQTGAVFVLSDGLMTFKWSHQI